MSDYSDAWTPLRVSLRGPNGEETAHRIYCAGFEDWLRRGVECGYVTRIGDDGALYNGVVSTTSCSAVVGTTAAEVVAADEGGEVQQEADEDAMSRRCQVPPRQDDAVSERRPAWEGPYPQAAPVAVVEVSTVTVEQPSTVDDTQVVPPYVDDVSATVATRDETVVGQGSDAVEEVAGKRKASDVEEDTDEDEYDDKATVNETSKGETEKVKTWADEMTEEEEGRKERPRWIRCNGVTRLTDGSTRRSLTAGLQSAYKWYGTRVVLNSVTGNKDDYPKDAVTTLLWPDAECYPYVLTFGVVVEETFGVRGWASTNSQHRRYLLVGARHSLETSADSVRIDLRAMLKTQHRFRPTSKYFEVERCEPLTAFYAWTEKLYAGYRLEYQRDLTSMLAECVGMRGGTVV